MLGPTSRWAVQGRHGDDDDAPYYPICAIDDDDYVQVEQACPLGQFCARNCYEGQCEVNLDRRLTGYHCAGNDDEAADCDRHENCQPCTACEDDRLTGYLSRRGLTCADVCGLPEYRVAEVVEVDRAVDYAFPVSQGPDDSVSRHYVGLVGAAGVTLLDAAVYWTDQGRTYDVCDGDTILHATLVDMDQQDEARIIAVCEDKNGEARIESMEPDEGARSHAFPEGHWALEGSKIFQFAYDPYYNAGGAVLLMNRDELVLESMSLTWQAAETIWTADLSGHNMNDVDSFIVTEGNFNSRIFVVGNADDGTGDRALARVNGNNGEVDWTMNVDSQTGTPVLVYIPDDIEAHDGEKVLMCSNSFFAAARYDEGTYYDDVHVSKTLVQDGLWLPGTGSARVAYDATRNVLVSAGILDGVLKVRASNPDTAAQLREFTFHDALPAAFADAQIDHVLPVNGGNLVAVCSYTNEAAERRPFLVKVDALTSQMYTPTYQPTPNTAAGAGPGSPSPSCADGTWAKSGDASKDCAWVAAFAEKRCLVKSADAVFAFEECHTSCGSCGHACLDSPTWHKNGDESKDCAWVKRTMNRCAVVGADGSVAYQACRKACQTCDYGICT